MGIRNYHLIGSAYSNTGSDVNLQVTIEGYGIVYDGPVTTTQGDMPTENILVDRDLLGNWPTDDLVAPSEKNVSILVTGGDLVFVTVGADKMDGTDLAKVLEFDYVLVKHNSAVNGELYTEGAGIQGYPVNVFDGETLALTLSAPGLYRLVPGGIWPTDPTAGNYDAAKAGLMTPSYEQGDALPDPVVPPAV